MIPKTAKPYQVAILIMFSQHKSPKQIASELHYRSPKPVWKVIRWYKDHLSLMGDSI